MGALFAVAGQVLPASRVQGWSSDALAVPTRYLRALHRAGGQEAVLLPVPLADATQRLNRFDGLLLLGGGDVDPARYGEEARPEIYGVDRDRDAFEIALIREAIHLGLPTLAICRGIQILNVTLGGSLHQDIAGREDLGPHGIPGGKEVLHKVSLKLDSRLARAMGVETVICSCHHHQALARLGNGLLPVGWTADGLIEAVELEDGWVVGVQWHPEDTAAEDPAQQRLFNGFVAQATRRSGR